jgi:hypothetical protein
MFATGTLNASADRLASALAWTRAGEPVWPDGQRPAVRLIIVLSSGMDNGRVRDETSDDHIAHVALLNGTVVFGIGFRGKGADKRLAKLATDTSGWFLEPDRKTDFREEAQRIMTSIRNRYLLGFTPSVFDGEEHRLEVKVRRSDVVVRARTAYQAPRPR